MSFHIGASVGAAVAGGVYTSYMKDRLRLQLGPGTSDRRIADIYDSITGTLPEWGTPERTAVGAAVSKMHQRSEVLRLTNLELQYSDVIGYAWTRSEFAYDAYYILSRYLTYVAFAVSVPVVLLALFFPNDRLG